MNKFLIIWLSRVILKISNSGTKEILRKIERNLVKLTRTRFNLRFNETCRQHNLLPVFTNVKLHDSAAKPQDFVVSFRRKLIEHENDKHRISIADLENLHNEYLTELRDELSELRYEASIEFLYRSIAKLENELTAKHTSKLCRLYGGNLYQKQDDCSFINLSDYDIPDNIKAVFSLGMNFHLKQKFNYTQRKIELEKLYENIPRNVKDNQIVIQDDERLRCDLKKHGLRNMHSHQADDILTREQHATIKEFRSNDNIIIRKADKSNTYVVFNSDTYNSKVNSILSDATKFEKLEKDPSHKIKKSINNLVTCVNAKQDGVKLSKIVGNCAPGYIYCNPKIHKNKNDPPMRPIISQIGTVTYNTAKELNALITKYLPKKYMVESTYEFIEISKSIKMPKLLASLDVDNLFTNVPVTETIEIILENTYNHNKLPPPDIPRHILKEFLHICNTATPFQAPDGTIYCQVDGVSMGCCLGPTFANFYMCNLENQILPTISNFDKCVYSRYVDDIFLAVPNYHVLDNIKKQFERHSVLKFTHEIEINRKLSFLDTLVTREHDYLKTAVYTKETNTGNLINYNSACPNRYKISVINTLLHRAYRICSDWPSVTNEVERLKQVFVNNNYPMSEIDNVINKFISRKFSSPSNNKSQPS